MSLDSSLYFVLSILKPLEKLVMLQRYVHFVGLFEFLMRRFEKI